MEKATEAIQNCLDTIVQITEPEDDLKALLPPQDFDFISLIDAPLPAMGQVNPCWSKGKLGDFEEEEDDDSADEKESEDKAQIKDDDLVPELFNGTKGTAKFPEVMKTPQEVNFKHAVLEKAAEEKGTVKDEDKPGLITDLIMASICTIADNFKEFGQNPQKASTWNKFLSITGFKTTPQDLFEDFLRESHGEFSNAFFRAESKEGKSGVMSFFMLFKLVTQSYM